MVILFFIPVSWHSTAYLEYQKVMQSSISGLLSRLYPCSPWYHCWKDFEGFRSRSIGSVVFQYLGLCCYWKSVCLISLQSLVKERSRLKARHPLSALWSFPWLYFRNGQFWLYLDEADLTNEPVLYDQDLISAFDSSGVNRDRISDGLLKWLCMTTRTDQWWQSESCLSSSFGNWWRWFILYWLA